MTEHLKIIRLTSENVKKIKAVEIVPEGNTVMITGANAEGKTSVLDSIWLALAGKEANKKNPDPIRYGENSAKVVVDLGEFIVTRTWTHKASTVKIENAEGAAFRSPQAMLDKITGKLSFDPLKFSLMAEKDQLKLLLEMLNLPIDIPTLDEDREELYGLRTRINRDIKNLEGQRNGLPTMYDVPDEELVAADVVDEMTEAQEQITINIERRRNFTAATDRELELANEISRLNQMLDSTKSMLKEQQAENATNAPLIESLVDPDMETFKCKLEDIEQTNAKIRQKRSLDELIAKITHEKGRSADLTDQIATIDETKATALKEAEMPLDGLGFNESGVTYMEVPFKQCSAAEQLRVSMAIAMAMNPTLRVIRITDGSLLDSSNLALIDQMAADKDFQVWIEMVNESGKIGIYIEDGMVVSNNQ